MNKVLAVLIAGLFAAGAYAAEPASAEADAAAANKGKAVDRAEMKKQGKPAGMVKTTPPGDTGKVAEGSGTGTTPTAADAAAQKRRDTRDERRPDKKTGGKKAVPVQGGTPQ